MRGPSGVLLIESGKFSYNLILHMEKVVPFLFDDFFFSRIDVIVKTDWHKNGLKRAI